MRRSPDRELDYDAARLERLAQRFRRDMWRSVAPDAVSESGVEVRQFGPVQATAFGDLPQAPLLNQIQGAAEPGAVEDRYLAEAIEWLRFREVDYRVPVATDRPAAAQAEAWLAARGYERGEGWVKLVRDARPVELPDPPGLMIYELGEEEVEGEGISRVAAQALELPITAAALFFSLHRKRPWRCYTAALGPEEPIVATGAMLVEDGVAQLGPGTTLPLARGRGCHLALLRRRVHDAVAAGCHTLFVDLCMADRAGQAGIRRNLERAGFRHAYESHGWQRPALRRAPIG